MAYVGFDDNPYSHEEGSLKRKYLFASNMFH
jgi:hypothetical protein